MAKVTKRETSALATKLGSKANKAVQTHRSDETYFGGGSDLPPGIENGIAQLAECKFDTYSKGDNQGEFYFYAAGIVKEPKEHDGIHVEGLRTSIMEPLCDTPNRSRETVQEHIGWIMNEFRKLGTDTEEMEDVDDLEEMAATLKEESPTFRFRTWQGDPTPQFPDPRVNHQWRGLVNYTPDDEDDVVEDNDDEETSESSSEDNLTVLAELADGGDGSAQQKIKAAAKEADVDTNAYDSWVEVVAAIESPEEDEVEESEDQEEEEKEDQEEEEQAAEISLQDSGSMADDGDQEEVDKLTGLAEGIGIDPDDYETWADLAEAIRTNSSDDEEEEDDWSPDSGEVYFYKPPKKKKPVECEVVSVSKSKRTVTVRNLDDKETYKSVSWDALDRW